MFRARGGKFTDNFFDRCVLYTNAESDMCRTQERLAHLDRASASGAEGGGFESHISHRRKTATQNQAFENVNIVRCFWSTKSY